MANYNQVIWSEGMFLRHEHFQQQARQLDYALSAKSQMLHGYDWGFKKLKIDNQLLLLSKFKLDQCTGVMRDGTLFQEGINCLNPSAIDVPQDTHDCLVYLALPLRGISDVDIDSADKPDYLARYRAETVEIQDSNVAGMTPTAVMLARLRPQLLLQTDNISQFCCMAVAKIKELTANGEVILDQNFIAPCLDSKVSAPLEKFLQQLHGLLVNRCESLAAKLNHPERYEAAQITDFLLMQLLNRYLMVTKHWVDNNQLHPELLYTELLKLAGELASFSDNQEQLKKLPPYLHDDLQNSFEPLQQFIVQALLTILTHRAVQLMMKEQESGLYFVPISDSTTLKEGEIIIAAKANLSVEALQHSFINQIKVGPIELIEDLVSSQLPGIESNALPVAPSQIPYHAGYHYFSLNKHNQLYEMLAEASGLAVHIGSDIPQLQLEVWLVKNN